MKLLKSLVIILSLTLGFQSMAQENPISNPNLDISVLEAEAMLCVEKFDLDYLVLFAADPSSEDVEWTRVENYLQNPVLEAKVQDYTAEEKMLCEAMAKGIVIGGVSNELVDIMKEVLGAMFGE